MLDSFLDPAQPWKMLLGGTLLVLLGIAIFGLMYTKSWSWLGYARIPVMGFGVIAWLTGVLSTFIGIVSLLKGG